MKNIIFIIIIAFIFSCKEKNDKSPIEEHYNNLLNIKYAKGFSVTNYSNYKILNIKNPWPKSRKSYRYLIIKQKALSQKHFSKTDFDGIIITPIKKIVVTSTTHIPALELLNEEKTLVGFPETNYISSEKTRELIKTGAVRDLGNNQAINTEVLLELNPNVLIGFGVDGKNNSFEIIKNSGIPVVYNGDWVEQSPLAKAEWIKFFAVFYNKEKKADSIFKIIENSYLKAKKIAQTAREKPTILSGAMHNDIWFLPNGTSTEAQLYKDANTNYLWQNNTGAGSLKLSFETVYTKAKNADIWLNPSNYSSLKALKNASMHHTMFNAFNNKTIYTFTNTTGKTGGVLYYELGFARPDIVLKDIIKTCHPKLLKNYKPFFLKPLK